MAVRLTTCCFASSQKKSGHKKGWGAGPEILVPRVLRAKVWQVAVLRLVLRCFGSDSDS